MGIDCHIGSQITEATPYLDAVDRMLDLVQSIEAAGIPIHHIDFGGGLGINYNGDTPPAADALWTQLLARLDARGYGDRQFMIEPGRSLVGNAGVCLTEVLYVKPGEQKNFCIVDAAMNDLPRPAMYQAFHAIVPLHAQPAAGAAAAQVYDVVGPVCESGDWLGRDRELAVQPGDQLAVLSAGAYCSAMGSNYNTRTRPAELLVDGSAGAPDPRPRDGGRHLPQRAAGRGLSACAIRSRLDPYQSGGGGAAVESVSLPDMRAPPWPTSNPWSCTGTRSTPA